LDDVIELNTYAVDVRYPDDAIEIDLNDAQEAYEVATRVKSFVAEKVEVEKTPQAEQQNN